MHSQNATRLYLIFAVLSCAFAAMAVNRYAPTALNADMILQSVISLQNVTVFYWGQNRFANFLPMLLSPIRDPEWNLLGLLWVYALSLFGLFAILSVHAAKFFFPERTAFTSYIFFAASLAAVFVGLKPGICAMLIAEGQPYPPSFFLCVAAASLIFRKLFSWFSVALGLLYLFAAIGINPSVILLIVYLSAIFLRRVNRYRFALLVCSSILIFGFWAWLSWLQPAVPVSYFTLDLESAKIGLTQSALHIYESFTPTFFIFACGAVVARAVMYFRSYDTALVDRAIFVLASLALGWFAVFAMSSWVKVNDYAVRYFTVTLLAVVGIIVVPLLALLHQVGARAQIYIATVLMFAFLAQVVRAPVSLNDYAVIRDVSADVSVAQINGLQYIAGDYWKAWPTVFQLMRGGHEAFGLAGRGEGNRAAVSRSLKQVARESTPKALCVSTPIETCAWWAAHITGRTWNSPSTACPAVACRLVTMDERSRLDLLGLSIDSVRP